MLYEVTADYHRESSTYHSRHTKYTREAADRMIAVHEAARDKRGENVEGIEIAFLDVDPAGVVLVVKGGETVTRCPSYYASDHETLALEPGEYPLVPARADGVPTDWESAYYASAIVPAVRVSGALYSGFGGVTFSSRELPRESVTYHWSDYAYNLGALLESGRIAVFQQGHFRRTP